VLVPDLDRVKLFFKLSNVLFLGHLHLLEDFFLGVELSVQIFSFGYSFVHLVLEFQVLFLQDLNLTVRWVQFNFRVFQGQNLIFQFRTSLQKTTVSLRVILLLIFVPLNPKLSSLFLIGNDFIETLDSFVELSLVKLQCLLDAGFACLQNDHGIGLLLITLV